MKLTPYPRALVWGTGGCEESVVFFLQPHWKHEEDRNGKGSARDAVIPEHVPQVDRLISSESVPENPLKKLLPMGLLAVLTISTFIITDYVIKTRTEIRSQAGVDDYKGQTQKEIDAKKPKTLSPDDYDRRRAQGLKPAPIPVDYDTQRAKGLVTEETAALKKNTQEALAKDLGYASVAEFQKAVAIGNGVSAGIGTGGNLFAAGFNGLNVDVSQYGPAALEAAGVTVNIPASYDKAVWTAQAEQRAGVAQQTSRSEAEQAAAGVAEGTMCSGGYGVGSVAKGTGGTGSVQCGSDGLWKPTNDTIPLTVIPAYISQTKDVIQLMGLLNITDPTQKSAFIQAYVPAANTNNPNAVNIALNAAVQAKTEAFIKSGGDTTGLTEVQISEAKVQRNINLAANELTGVLLSDARAPTSTVQLYAKIAAIQSKYGLTAEQIAQLEKSIQPQLDKQIADAKKNNEVLNKASEAYVKYFSANSADCSGGGARQQACERGAAKAAQAVVGKTLTTKELSLVKTSYDNLVNAQNAQKAYETEAGKFETLYPGGSKAFTDSFSVQKKVVDIALQSTLASWKKVNDAITIADIQTMYKDRKAADQATQEFLDARVAYDDCAKAINLRCDSEAKAATNALAKALEANKKLNPQSTASDIQKIYQDQMYAQVKENQAFRAALPSFQEAIGKTRISCSSGSYSQLGCVDARNTIKTLIAQVPSLKPVYDEVLKVDQRTSLVSKFTDTYNGPPTSSRNPFDPRTWFTPTTGDISARGVYREQGQPGVEVGERLNTIENQIKNTFTDSNSEEAKQFMTDLRLELSNPLSLNELTRQVYVLQDIINGKSWNDAIENKGGVAGNLDVAFCDKSCAEQKLSELKKHPLYKEYGIGVEQGYDYTESVIEKLKSIYEQAQKVNSCGKTNTSSCGVFASELARMLEEFNQGKNSGNILSKQDVITLYENPTSLKTGSQWTLREQAALIRIQPDLTELAPLLKDEFFNKLENGTYKPLVLEQQLNNMKKNPIVQLLLTANRIDPDIAKGLATQAEADLAMAKLKDFKDANGNYDVRKAHEYLSWVPTIDGLRGAIGSTNRLALLSFYSGASIDKVSSFLGNITGDTKAKEEFVIRWDSFRGDYMMSKTAMQGAMLLAVPFTAPLLASARLAPPLASAAMTYLSNTVMWSATVGSIGNTVAVCDGSAGSQDACNWSRANTAFMLASSIIGTLASPLHAAAEEMAKATGDDVLKAVGNTAEQERLLNLFGKPIKISVGMPNVIKSAEKVMAPAGTLLFGSQGIKAMAQGDYVGAATNFLMAFGSGVRTFNINTPEFMNAAKWSNRGGITLMTGAACAGGLNAGCLDSMQFMALEGGGFVSERSASKLVAEEGVRAREAVKSPEERLVEAETKVKEQFDIDNNGKIVFGSDGKPVLKSGADSVAAEIAKATYGRTLQEKGMHLAQADIIYDYLESPYKRNALKQLSDALTGVTKSSSSINELKAQFENAQKEWADVVKTTKGFGTDEYTEASRRTNEAYQALDAVYRGGSTLTRFSNFMKQTLGLAGVNKSLDELKNIPEQIRQLETLKTEEDAKRTTPGADTAAIQNKIKEIDTLIGELNAVNPRDANAKLLVKQADTKRLQNELALQKQELIDQTNTALKLNNEAQLLESQGKAVEAQAARENAQRAIENSNAIDTAIKRTQENIVSANTEAAKLHALALVETYQTVEQVRTTSEQSPLGKVVTGGRNTIATLAVSVGLIQPQRTFEETLDALVGPVLTPEQQRKAKEAARFRQYTEGDRKAVSASYEQDGTFRVNVDTSIIPWYRPGDKRVVAEKAKTIETAGRDFQIYWDPAMRQAGKMGELVRVTLSDKTVLEPKTGESPTDFAFRISQDRILHPETYINANITSKDISGNEISSSFFTFRSSEEQPQAEILLNTALVPGTKLIEGSTSLGKTDVMLSATMYLKRALLGKDTKFTVLFNKPDALNNFRAIFTDEVAQKMGLTVYDVTQTPPPTGDVNKITRANVFAGTSDAIFNSLEDTGMGKFLITKMTGSVPIIDEAHVTSRLDTSYIKSVGDTEFLTSTVKTRFQTLFDPNNGASPLGFLAKEHIDYLTSGDPTKNLLEEVKVTDKGETAEGGLRFKKDVADQAYKAIVESLAKEYPDVAELQNLKAVGKDQIQNALKLFKSRDAKDNVKLQEAQIALNDAISSLNSVERLMVQIPGNDYAIGKKTIVETLGGVRQSRGIDAVVPREENVPMYRQFSKTHDELAYQYLGRMFLEKDSTKVPKMDTLTLSVTRSAKETNYGRFFRDVFNADEGILFSATTNRIANQWKSRFGVNLEVFTAGQGYVIPPRWSDVDFEPVATLNDIGGASAVKVGTAPRMYVIGAPGTENAKLVESLIRVSQTSGRDVVTIGGDGKILLYGKGGGAPVDITKEGLENINKLEIEYQGRKEVLDVVYELGRNYETDLKSLREAVFIPIVDKKSDYTDFVQTIGRDRCSGGCREVHIVYLGEKTGFTKENALANFKVNEVRNIQATNLNDVGRSGETKNAGIRFLTQLQTLNQKRGIFDIFRSRPSTTEVTDLFAKLRSDWQAYSDLDTSIGVEALTPQARIVQDVNTLQTFINRAYENTEIRGKLSASAEDFLRASYKKELFTEKDITFLSPQAELGDLTSAYAKDIEATYRIIDSKGIEVAQFTGKPTPDVISRAISEAGYFNAKDALSFQLKKGADTLAKITFQPRAQGEPTGNALNGIQLADHINSTYYVYDFRSKIVEGERGSDLVKAFYAMVGEQMPQKEVVTQPGIDQQAVQQAQLAQTGKATAQTLDLTTPENRQLAADNAKSVPDYTPSQSYTPSERIALIGGIRAVSPAGAQRIAAEKSMEDLKRGDLEDISFTSPQVNIGDSITSGRNTLVVLPQLQVVTFDEQGNPIGVGFVRDVPLDVKSRNSYVVLPWNVKSTTGTAQELINKKDNVVVTGFGNITQVQRVQDETVRKQVVTELLRAQQEEKDLTEVSNEAKAKLRADMEAQLPGIEIDNYTFDAAVVYLASVVTNDVTSENQTLPIVKLGLPSTKSDGTEVHKDAVVASLREMVTQKPSQVQQPQPTSFISRLQALWARIVYEFFGQYQEQLPQVTMTQQVAPQAPIRPVQQPQATTPISWDKVEKDMAVTFETGFPWNRKMNQGIISKVEPDADNKQVRVEITVTDANGKKYVFPNRIYSDTKKEFSVILPIPPQTQPLPVVLSGPEDRLLAIQSQARSGEAFPNIGLDQINTQNTIKIYSDTYNTITDRDTLAAEIFGLWEEKDQKNYSADQHQLGVALAYADAVLAYRQQQTTQQAAAQSATSVPAVLPPQPPAQPPMVAPPVVSAPTQAAKDAFAITPEEAQAVVLDFEQEVQKVGGIEKWLHKRVGKEATSYLFTYNNKMYAVKASIIDSEVQKFTVYAERQKAFASEIAKKTGNFAPVEIVLRKNSQTVIVQRFVEGETLYMQEALDAKKEFEQQGIIVGDPAGNIIHTDLYGNVLIDFGDVGVPGAAQPQISTQPAQGAIIKTRLKELAPLVEMPEAEKVTPSIGEQFEARINDLTSNRDFTGALAGKDFEISNALRNLKAATDLNEQIRLMNVIITLIDTERKSLATNKATAFHASGLRDLLVNEIDGLVVLGRKYIAEQKAKSTAPPAPAEEAELEAEEVPIAEKPAPVKETPMTPTQQQSLVVNLLPESLRGNTIAIKFIQAAISQFPPLSVYTQIDQAFKTPEVQKTLGNIQQMVGQTQNDIEGYRVLIPVIVKAIAANPAQIGTVLTDVQKALEAIQRTTWEGIPEKISGMNAQEVLNYVKQQYPSVYNELISYKTISNDENFKLFLAPYLKVYFQQRRNQMTLPNNLVWHGTRERFDALQKLLSEQELSVLLGKDLPAFDPKIDYTIEIFDEYGNQLNTDVFLQSLENAYGKGFEVKGPGYFLRVRKNPNTKVVLSFDMKYLSGLNAIKTVTDNLMGDYGLHAVFGVIARAVETYNQAYPNHKLVLIHTTGDEGIIIDESEILMDEDDSNMLFTGIRSAVQGTSLPFMEFDANGNETIVEQPADIHRSESNPIVNVEGVEKLFTDAGYTFDQRIALLRQTQPVLSEEDLTDEILDSYATDEQKSQYLLNFEDLYYDPALLSSVISFERDTENKTLLNVYREKANFVKNLLKRREGNLGSTYLVKVDLPGLIKVLNDLIGEGYAEGNKAKVKMFQEIINALPLSIRQQLATNPLDILSVGSELTMVFDIEADAKAAVDAINALSVLFERPGKPTYPMIFPASLAMVDFSSPRLAQDLDRALQTLSQKQLSIATQKIRDLIAAGDVNDPSVRFFLDYYQPYNKRGVTRLRRLDVAPSDIVALRALSKETDNGMGDILDLPAYRDQLVRIIDTWLNVPMQSESIHEDPDKIVVSQTNELLISAQDEIVALNAQLALQKEELDKGKAELETLRQKIQALKTKETNQEKALADRDGQIMRLQGQIETLQNEKTAVETDQVKKATTLARRNTQIEKLKTQILQLQGEIGGLQTTADWLAGVTGQKAEQPEVIPQETVQQTQQAQQKQLPAPEQPFGLLSAPQRVIIPQKQTNEGVIALPAKSQSTLDAEAEMKRQAMINEVLDANTGPTLVAESLQVLTPSEVDNILQGIAGAESQSRTSAFAALRNTIERRAQELSNEASILGEADRWALIADVLQNDKGATIIERTLTPTFAAETIEALTQMSDPLDQILTNLSQTISDADKKTFRGVLLTAINQVRGNARVQQNLKSDVNSGNTPDAVHVLTVRLRVVLPEQYTWIYDEPVILEYVLGQVVAEKVIVPRAQVERKQPAQPSAPKTTKPVVEVIPLSDEEIPQAIVIHTGFAKLSEPLQTQVAKAISNTRSVVQNMEQFARLPAQAQETVLQTGIRSRFPLEMSGMTQVAYDKATTEASIMLYAGMMTQKDYGAILPKELKDLIQAKKQFLNRLFRPDCGAFLVQKIFAAEGGVSCGQTPAWISVLDELTNPPFFTILKLVSGEMSSYFARVRGLTDLSLMKRGAVKIRIEEEEFVPELLVPTAISHTLNKFLVDSIDVFMESNPTTHKDLIASLSSESFRQFMDIMFTVLTPEDQREAEKLVNALTQVAVNVSPDEWTFDLTTDVVRMMNDLEKGISNEGPFSTALEAISTASQKERQVKIETLLGTLSDTTSGRLDGEKTADILLGTTVFQQSLISTVLDTAVADEVISAQQIEDNQSLIDDIRNGLTQISDVAAAMQTTPYTRNPMDINAILSWMKAVVDKARIESELQTYRDFQTEFQKKQDELEATSVQTQEVIQQLELNKAIFESVRERMVEAERAAVEGRPLQLSSSLDFLIQDAVEKITSDLLVSQWIEAELRKEVQNIVFSRNTIEFEDALIVKGLEYRLQAELLSQLWGSDYDSTVVELTPLAEAFLQYYTQYSQGANVQTVLSDQQIGKQLSDISDPNRFKQFLLAKVQERISLSEQELIAELRQSHSRIVAVTERLSEKSIVNLNRLRSVIISDTTNPQYIAETLISIKTLLGASRLDAIQELLEQEQWLRDSRYADILNRILDEKSTLEFELAIAALGKKGIALKSKADNRVINPITSTAQLSKTALQRAPKEVRALANAVSKKLKEIEKREENPNVFGITKLSGNTWIRIFNGLRLMSVVTGQAAQIDSTIQNVLENVPKIPSQENREVIADITSHIVGTLQFFGEYIRGLFLPSQHEPINLGLTSVSPLTATEQGVSTAVQSSQQTEVTKTQQPPLPVHQQTAVPETQRIPTEPNPATLVPTQETPPNIFHILFGDIADEAIEARHEKLDSMTNQEKTHYYELIGGKEHINDLTVNFVFLGMDTSAQRGGNTDIGRSDQIHLLSYNLETNHIVITSVNRDILDPTLDAPINTVTNIDENGQPRSSQEVESIFTHITGKPIDGILRVDFQGAIQLFDTLVPEGIQLVNTSGAKIKGQGLDGEQYTFPRERPFRVHGNGALAFVRSRDEITQEFAHYGTTARESAATQVIEAVIGQLTKEMNPSEIADLLQRIQDSTEKIQTLENSHHVQMSWEFDDEKEQPLNLTQLLNVVFHALKTPENLGFLTRALLGAIQNSQLIEPTITRVVIGPKPDTSLVPGEPDIINHTNFALSTKFVIGANGEQLLREGDEDVYWQSVRDFINANIEPIPVVQSGQGVQEAPTTLVVPNPQSYLPASEQLLAFLTESIPDSRNPVVKTVEDRADGILGQWEENICGLSLRFIAPVYAANGSGGFNCSTQTRTVLEGIRTVLKRMPARWIAIKMSLLSKNIGVQQPDQGQEQPSQTISEGKEVIQTQSNSLLDQIQG